MNNNTPKKSIACFGEILLRLSSQSDKSIDKSVSFDVHIGGAECNVAVNLSCLGYTSKMLSSIPCGKLGSLVINQLKLHSVNSDSILRDKGRLGQYILESRGLFLQPEIIYDREYSCFSKLKQGDWDWQAELTNTDLFHFSGINLALNDHVASESISAANQANKQQLLVSFDANYRPSLWENRVELASGWFDQALRSANIAFLTEQDIALVIKEFAINNRMSDEEKRECAFKLAFDKYPDLKWIASTFRNHSVDGTLSYKGILSNRESHSYSQTRIISIMRDRIGTGDAFASGIIFGILNDMNEIETVEFAIALATAKHSIYGDFTALSQDDIKAIINDDWFNLKR